MISKSYSIQKFVIELFKGNSPVGYYVGKNQQGLVQYGKLQEARAKNHICEQLSRAYGDEYTFVARTCVEHHTDIYYHESEPFNSNDIRVLWVICREERPDSEAVFLKNIKKDTVFINKKKQDIIH